MAKQMKVVSNVAASFATELAVYTLTIKSKPAGVATFTVTRTSSPLKKAATGTLSNGAKIYYNDTLTASATAASNYAAPTLDWTSKTVTGDVTAGVKAGAYSEPYYTCDCCGYYGPASDFVYIDAYSAICKNCN